MLKVIPMEAMIGILLWVGLIITAQAFQEVPKKHSVAVALGLMPALAAWALLLIETTLRKTGASLYEWCLSSSGNSTRLRYGRQPPRFSFFGVIHAYLLTPAGVQNRFGFGAAKAYAFAYLIAALLLVALHFYNRGRESESTGIIA